MQRKNKDLVKKSVMVFLGTNHEKEYQDIKVSQLRASLLNI